MWKVEHMKKLGEREHHRIGISIYRKYHNIPDDDETEPTGQVVLFFVLIKCWHRPQQRLLITIAAFSLELARYGKLLWSAQ